MRKQKNKKTLVVFAGVIACLVAGYFLGTLLFKDMAPYITLPKFAGNSNKLGSNPLQDMTLYVDANSNAVKQAAAWRSTQPAKAALMDRLAKQPTAKWLTSTEGLAGLDDYLKAAKAANAVPVLVAYNVPLRDCGRYSAGGASAASEYKTFIDSLATRLKGSRAIVILEPDALAGIEAFNDKGQPCLPDEGRKMYYTLLRDAVTRLKAQAGTTVYVDAGNSAWMPDAAKMAARLENAGVDKADGFSLNISNFQSTADTTAYGEDIAARIGGKHFVIDTSRNGLGGYSNPTYPDFNWCNPPGRALGHFPTTATGNQLVDAYLYIKYPGESDGKDSDSKKCFGGPAAGTWWPDYALGLIERWPQTLQPR